MGAGAVRTGLVLAIGFAVWGYSPPALAVVGDTVITDQGKPIPGAKVSLNLPDGSTATGTTDAAGRVAIPIPDSPQPRTGTVKVEREGQPPHEQTATIPGGESAFKVCADTAGGLIVLGKAALDRVREAATPLRVGTHSEVGSGARATQKAGETAGNLLGSALGGLSRGGGFGIGPMGGRGGSMMNAPLHSGSSSDQPATKPDPIPQSEKRIFTDPASGVRLAVGGKMTPEGLLVSASILDSPDDGTFQDIHLQNPEGQLAGPIEYLIYELYQDWSLKVWWTRDTFVNGQHVKHEEGGWSASGRNFLGTFALPREGEGLWKRLGFSNAAKGARSLGALFPLAPETAQTVPFNLVIHITRPGQEVVTTVPFVLAMPPGGWAGGAGPVPFLMVN